MGRFHPCTSKCHGGWRRDGVIKKIEFNAKVLKKQRATGWS